MSQSHVDSPDARPTPTIEDYLTFIYVMERDGDKVIAARLAEALEVARPTVAMTLKRMERDQWITSESRKGIKLTEEGNKAARSVIRRHMLTEWVLARMLNVPWSQIHAEAHRIEHTISDEIEARMRTNLEDPQLCPHGNPLPGFEHLTANWVPLTALKPGDGGTMRRIHEMAEDKPDLIRFLEANELLPGARVQVVEVLPFNQTITVAVAERQVTLGFTIARYLFCERSG